MPNFIQIFETNFLAPPHMLTQGLGPNFSAEVVMRPVSPEFEPNINFMGEHDDNKLLRDRCFLLESYYNSIYKPHEPSRHTQTQPSVVDRA